MFQKSILFAILSCLFSSYNLYSSMVLTSITENEQGVIVRKEYRRPSDIGNHTCTAGYVKLYPLVAKDPNDEDGCPVSGEVISSLCDCDRWVIMGYKFTVLVFNRLMYESNDSTSEMHNQLKSSINNLKKIE